jgi:hypothetical protein
MKMNKTVGGQFEPEIGGQTSSPPVQEASSPVAPYSICLHKVSLQGLYYEVAAKP